MNEARDERASNEGSGMWSNRAPCLPVAPSGIRHRAVVAARFLDRVRGFLAPRPPNCALIIVPCRSIHTFGMAFPLDVAFFDRHGRVVHVHRAVPPRRHVRCRGAYGALERRACDEAWYCEGDEVTICIDE